MRSLVKQDLGKSDKIHPTLFPPYLLQLYKRVSVCLFVLPFL